MMLNTEENINIGKYNSKEQVETKHRINISDLDGINISDLDGMKIENTCDKIQGYMLFRIQRLEVLYYFSRWLQR